MARSSFSMDDALFGRLSGRAGELDRSVSWCVSRAVEAWLDGAGGGAGASGVAGSPRAGTEKAPVPGAANSGPATPRASVPAFARVQRLGEGPPRTIGRKS